MPSFETKTRVPYSPRQMYDLVADVERYPEFLPLCQALRVRSREQNDEGQVVLVAALAGFAVLVAGMVLVRYGLLAPVPGLPVFTDLTRPLTVLLAVLFGGLVLTAMNLLMFSAVLKISTESFVAASAFVPLMTLILQEAAHAGSLIAAAPSGRQLLLVMLVVIAGNIIIVAAGMRRHGRPRR